MFEVRGRFVNRDVTISWDNGELGGDEFAVRWAKNIAEIREGRSVGPVCGPYTQTKHLDNALSAYFILTQSLDEVYDVTGDVPTVPVTPGVIH